MDHGKSANSAAKTLRVLHAVARLDSARKLSEIAEESGIPKATTHRLLGTLIEEGYVVPEGGGSYGVGPQLRSMAAQVLADDTVGIESTLRALQQRLGQAVHLAVLGGEFATYTHKVEPGHAYRIATGVGMPVPLHASAAGKALLAYLPPAEAAALLDRAGLPERTPHTITDRGRLDEELARVREQGYASEYEEADESVCSIAAPVLDRDGYPRAAVSVSSLTFLVTEEQLRTFAPTVCDTAAEVARRL